MKKTHYEILGMPRTATAQQIKRRYRQLARQYHPDVAQDKAAAKTAFIEISEAYQTLINPDKRMIYDISMDAEMFEIQTRSPASPRASTTQSTRSERSRASTGETRAAQAQRWVREAEAAFIRRQFQSAIHACKEAQRLDQRNVKAYTILGDIYGIQGQLENAIAMYTIAVQLDPKSAEIQAKLGRLTRHRAGGVGGERYSTLKIGLNLMGWPAIALMFVMLIINPGQPILWLQQNLSVLSAWSTMLFVVLLVTGALTGFLLSVNETVQSLDDELIFQSVRSTGTRPASYPVGLILIIFNLFSFYLAAVIYALIGWIQESLSKSIMRAFLATFMIVLLASLVYTAGRMQVLIFGGNVVFPALLFGWAIGDLFRPGW